MLLPQHPHPMGPKFLQIQGCQGNGFLSGLEGAFHCSKFHKRFKSFRLKPEAWLTDSFHIPSSSRSPDFSSGPDNSLVKK